MSIRDIFNKMPNSRKDLEERVLTYSPEIRRKIEENSQYKERFDEITRGEFEKYKPYIEKGASHWSGAVGHGFGYLGDILFYGSAIAAASNPALAPFMLTGLLLKKVNLGMQAPEKLRSLSYAKNTGDSAGAAKNIAEGLLSYIPGGTILDEGLRRIAQKSLVKSTLYKLYDEFGIEKKPWYARLREYLKDKYTGVKDRAENIINPGKFQPVAA